MTIPPLRRLKYADVEFAIRRIRERLPNASAAVLDDVFGALHDALLSFNPAICTWEGYRGSVVRDVIADAIARERAGEARRDDLQAVITAERRR